MRIEHPNKDLSKPTKRPKKHLKFAKYKKGKAWYKWLRVRKEWFQLNPGAYYSCYLCGKYMLPKETTLDHVIPKSNAKNYPNRHDFSNLKPCCWTCNSEKGSKVLDVV